MWKELDYGAMTEAEKQMLVSEVNLLRELKSPYIVRYYDRIIDRARTTIYIIMEYCKGGDLSTVISRCKKEVYVIYLISMETSNHNLFHSSTEHYHIGVQYM